ncbi:hypothetical protein M407DRAFT_45735, partial [Tulasnella calospora MUT 4182]
PPELDSTINRILASHKTVRGVMICSREGPIIRQAGSAFEGDLGKKYAVGVKKVVDSCKAGLIDDVFGGTGGESASVSFQWLDELKFLRIRTKRHELMITPDERYLLIVIQDPTQ